MPTASYTTRAASLLPTTFLHEFNNKAPTSPAKEPTDMLQSLLPSPLKVLQDGTQGCHATA